MSYKDDVVLLFVCIFEFKVNKRRCCRTIKYDINAANFLPCLQLYRYDGMMHLCGRVSQSLDEEERIQFLWRNTRDCRPWVMQQQKAECETQQKFPTSCDCHDPSAPCWENFLRFVICMWEGVTKMIPQPSLFLMLCVRAPTSNTRNFNWLGQSVVANIFPLDLL